MEKTFNKITLVLRVIAYILYFYLAVKSGGTILGLLLFNICFWVGIVSCGGFLKNILLDRDGLFDDISLSFALGVMFLYLNFILFDMLGVKRLMIALPLLVGFYNLYKNYKKVALDGTLKGCKWVLYITCIGFSFAFILCAMLPFARADLTKNFYLHQDMVWSAGNAASVYLGFPVMDMRFAGTTLNYHYLNDVTAGMLAVSTNQPAYEVFCLYWYMAVAMVLIIALYQTAKNFTDSDFLRALMPFTVLFCVRDTGIIQYITNINGQGSATLLLCAGLSLLKYAEGQNIKQLSSVKKIANVVAFVSVGFVMSMFKSTIGVLFILANIASCIVGTFTKKTKYENVVISLCLALGFGIAYKFVLGTAVNNLVFDGLNGLKLIFRQIYKHTSFAIFVYVLALVYSLLNFKKLSFSQLCTNAMFVGGMVAYCVYTHYSYSQVYFALIAMPAMWLSSLEFLGKAEKKKKELSVLLALLVIICAIPNAIKLLPNARSGVQAALRIYNLRLSDYDESYITADDYDAMLWLRENSAQNEIFATNRNNKYFARAEGTFHYYSAVSQRACYLESYRYTMDYSGKYWEVRRRLEEVSDNIFQNMTETEAFSLAKSENINYLVVFKPLNQCEWETAPAYENSSVAIYRV